jgi:hypothetical protein
MKKFWDFSAGRPLSIRPLAKGSAAYFCRGLPWGKASALRPTFRSDPELALLPMNHREFLAALAWRAAR